jgi:2-methylaconitate cis-trans-isomerase PrpF
MAVRNPIPAAFLRGGTSKGIFIKRSDLPDDQAQWDRIFRGIMGSPDKEHGRQLNGMGGGISSLSKICVVGPPSVAWHGSLVDVEYTFVQVGIRDGNIDYSGNCGNLSSMIGVFALDEGICGHPGKLTGSTATIRSFNTNTGKLINTSFPVSVSNDKYTPMLDLDQTSVAGVPGRASQITLDFVSPGGSRTGKLLPTGNTTDTVQVAAGDKSLPLRMSLIDATNPTVFVVLSDLHDVFSLPETSTIDFASPPILKVLEFIRQQGAMLMCLDPLAQAQPKIAILSPPLPSDPDVDVFVHALSMGMLHKAVPMTVGLCLGVAAHVEGTLPWQIVQHSRASRRDDGGQLIKIKHPSGTVDVGAEFKGDGEVKNAKVVRTGRRLMKGVVWW